jgi:chitinase
MRSTRELRARRRSGLWTATAATATALALTGLVAPSAHSAPARASAPAITAAPRVAPYLDITMNTPSLVQAAQATGQKNYELAFALGSSGGCDPKWGGTIAIDDQRITQDVAGLKALGGDVVVGTGGSVGPYLETSCSSADALETAYKKVLDTVGSNHLDVDVEAAIPQDMVNQALKQLQAERGTSVTYTLRVQAQDYGVDPYSLQVLQSAKNAGVQVDVNPMVMNFGFSGNWGDAMVSAAKATEGQMKAIWTGKTDAQLYAMLGVTPMIGRNDSGMTTTQADANKVLSFARSNHIASIGFWSLGRDNGGCPSGGVSPTCSGISQSAWEFTDIFKGYAG